MGSAGILIIKAFAGGILVLAFAILGQVLHPKRFAGVFAAAPSVALAGLTITLVSKGDAQAAMSAMGMIVGAIGFIGFTLSARRLVAHFDALRGSALACVVWLAIAGAGYGIFLR